MQRVYGNRALSPRDIWRSSRDTGGLFSPLCGVARARVGIRPGTGDPGANSSGWALDAYKTVQSVQ